MDFVRRILSRADCSVGARWKKNGQAPAPAGRSITRAASDATYSGFSASFPPLSPHAVGKTISTSRLELGGGEINRRLREKIASRLAEGKSRTERITMSRGRWKVGEKDGRTCAKLEEEEKKNHTGLEPSGWTTMRRRQPPPNI